MSQEIQKIKVKDLVLWTENPRDPIEASAKDQDVVDRALSDPHSKWELGKLAKEMGEYYDYSEIPIVVYKDGSPIVYDGNRRVVLAKIKLGLVQCEDFNISLPAIDEEIPCDVCDETTALKSIYRKHVELRNTWDPLERDIFAAKYLGEEKSRFLLFDECTGGFITNHPEMNQGFVRKEILTDSVLTEMGFGFEKGRMLTRHSDDEVSVLINDLLSKIKGKQITTRINRGKPLDVLDQRSKDIIASNKGNAFRTYQAKPAEKTAEQPSSTASQRKTPITRKSATTLFGEKLILKSGNVNNLYSDIVTLYEYVTSVKKAFSPTIPAVFRMALRLLCETASSEMGYTDINDYLKKYFPLAKKTMSQDTKTLLSNQNVTESSLAQLFHTGAHNYVSSTSSEQAIALSIALGAMLKISHGK